MSPRVDLAIVGSGFGGALLAAIASRLGLSVVLLEKGAHPRFAIGESSSPLANLLLESLCRRYGLSELAPLAKWGTWQAARPEIGCGLKRGFSFFHHRLGEEFGRDPERADQLLVAASPHDAVADTHWYRSDVDQFFVAQARAAGAEYVDRIALDTLEPSAGDVRLGGWREGERMDFRARFLVDASGPRGFVHRALGLRAGKFRDMPATRGIYSHFRGVRRWADLAPGEDVPPYPVDDAALHHIFPGGWIWVLRFSNGVTSAGAALAPGLAREIGADDGALAWERLLRLLPSVGRQFAGASPIRPFSSVRTLPYRAARACGPGWTMLPSAAAFVDPLLSTGFPLTLLGIERIARAIEETWEDDRRWQERIAGIAALTMEEAERASLLVGTLWRCFDDFELFSSIAMFYFASASRAEALRRLGRPERTFLSGDDGPFQRALTRVSDRVRARAPEGFRAAERAGLLEEIRGGIEPSNVAGLLDPARRNWYPADPADLIRSAGKLGASPQEMEEILDRSGFRTPPVPPAGPATVPTA